MRVAAREEGATEEGRVGVIHDDGGCACGENGGDEADDGGDDGGDDDDDDGVDYGGDDEQKANLFSRAP